MRWEMRKALAVCDLYLVDRVGNKKAYEVQRSQIKELIRIIGRKGQIFSVTFEKKDRSVRKMTGRLGCHRKAAELNKTGINRNTHADYPQYVRLMEVTPGIRDLKGKYRAPECQFRTFNLDTVKSIRGAGSVFYVSGDPCYTY